MKTTSVAALKRGVLLYWSLWHTVVFATQSLAGLQDLGLVGKGDLPLLNSSRVAFGRAAGVGGVWRAGFIAWEGVAAITFWIALRRFRDTKLSRLRTSAAAFSLGLGLYGVLAILDRTVAGPSYETNHLLILIGLLASFLVVLFLPE